MNNGISVTLSKVKKLAVNVGDKIRLSKKTKQLFRPRLKKMYMVCRLRKRHFDPKFVVISIEDIHPHTYSFNMKPYNF